MIVKHQKFVGLLTVLFVSFAATSAFAVVAFKNMYGDYDVVSCASKTKEVTAEDVLKACERTQIWIRASAQDKNISDFTFRSSQASGLSDLKFGVSASADLGQDLNNLYFEKGSQFAYLKNEYQEGSFWSFSEISMSQIENGLYKLIIRTRNQGGATAAENVSYHYEMTLRLHSSEKSFGWYLLYGFQPH